MNNVEKVPHGGTRMKTAWRRKRALERLQENVKRYKDGKPINKLQEQMMGDVGFWQDKIAKAEACIEGLHKKGIA